MTDDREINFEEAAAEARAPLNGESASFYAEGPEPDGDEDLDLPDPLDDLSAEQVTLTEGQQRRRENLRLHRKTAADNLRAARKLHQRGDMRGTELLEKYRRAVDWGVGTPNPDRRADLLTWAAQLEDTLSFLEEGRAERRATLTPEQWQAGEEMLQPLRQAIADTYAMADAARY